MQFGGQESGTVLIHTNIIYCVIKGFMIDLHIKENSQHIQRGQAKAKRGGQMPPERNPV